MARVAHEKACYPKKGCTPYLGQTSFFKTTGNRKQLAFLAGNHNDVGFLHYEGESPETSASQRSLGRWRA
jgi:hypothetical protein